MTITYNGAVTEIPDGTSVGELVRARTDDRRRVAVARNGEVVPRGEWDTTGLSEGDLVEVLAPVAGG
jgi:sulfur carrier protein